MENKGTGIGLLGVLLIVFVVLKLIGVIKWSWVWVLAPLWIPVAIVTLIVVIIGAIALIKNG